MSNEPKKSLPRIRTFAQDLEMEREKHHLPPTGASAVHTPTTAPTPQAAAAVAVDVKISEKSLEVAPDTKNVSKETTPTEAPKQAPTIVATPIKDEPPQLPLKKVSVREKKRDLATPRIEGGGTVITDNKKVSPGFFFAVFTSLNHWIASLQKQKKTASPTYTVIDSERRKGVIQKATTKTGSIFTADSETLAEEVRKRQSIGVIRKPAEDTDVSWTPNTEPGYPLLTGTTANVQVEFKQRSVPQVETFVAPPPPIESPAPIVVRKKITPPKATTETPAWEQTPPSVITPRTLPQEERVVPTWATTPPPPVAPAPIPVPVVETLPPVESDDSIEDESYELTTPEAHYRIRSIGDVTKINTNYLSLGVVGAVLGLVILIFIIRALFLFLGENTLSTTLEPATPMLTKATVVDAELTAITSEAFVIAVQQSDTDMPGTRELRLLKSDASLVSKEEFARITGMDLAPRIVQSATTMRFAHIGTERAIIIDVTDPTNALGSLLEWEPMMLNDIGSIFTIAKQSEPVTYTDLRLEGADVRVASVGETDLFVYGFIDQNTIVLAESVTAFTEALANK